MLQKFPPKRGISFNHQRMSQQNKSIWIFLGIRLLSHINNDRVGNLIVQTLVG